MPSHHIAKPLDVLDGVGLFAFSLNPKANNGEAHSSPATR